MVVSAWVSKQPSEIIPLWIDDFGQDRASVIERAKQQKWFIHKTNGARKQV